MFKKILFVALVVSCLPGCSMKSLMVKTFEVALPDIRLAFYGEKSPRQAMLAGPALLKILDSLIISAPQNETLLFEGVQMYGSYGLSFADDHPEWAARIHERGFEYGVRLLELSSGNWSDAFNRGLPALEKRLATATLNDLPALFWTAANWAGKINVSKRDITAVADLPLPSAIMQWVYKKDPTYFHASPAMFLARYHSSRPAHLGGDPEKAKAYFEEALRIGKGRFLLTKVYYARDYATMNQDLALFDRLLQEVIEADDNIMPEFLLGTAVAKEMARNLQKEKNRWFNISQESEGTHSGTPGDSLPDFDGGDLPDLDD